MSDSITVDATRLPLLSQEFRLPAVAALWQQFTERADREGWPSARLLAALAELELGERAQRRIQRHLMEAHLPPGKTLDSFGFATVQWSAAPTSRHWPAATPGWPRGQRPAVRPQWLRQIPSRAGAGLSGRRWATR